MKAAEVAILILFGIATINSPLTKKAGGGTYSHSFSKVEVKVERRTRNWNNMYVCDVGMKIIKKKITTFYALNASWMIIIHSHLS